ncbi:MAG TPA: ABC transporter ATP-binding protein, partial [Polyangiaceae bacterium]
SGGATEPYGWFDANVRAMASTVNTTNRAVSELVRRLRPSPRLLAGTIFLLLLAGVFEGATVGLLVPLLAMIVSPDSTATLPVVGGLIEFLPPERRVLALGGGILALVLLKNLLVLGGNLASGAVRARAVIELRRQLLERVLYAPPATLERHTSGEITDVFVAESYRVNRFVEACIVFIQRSVVTLSYIAAMLIVSWRLTLAAVAVGVVVAFAARKLGRGVLRQGRELSQASGALGRHVTEVVGGLRTIRTTASAETFAGKFSEQSVIHAWADVGSSRALALQQGAIETLGVAGALALTALAHSMWLASGTLDVPRFLAFGFGLVRMLPSLNFAYATHGLITASVGSIERILSWLELPVYPSRPFGERAVPRLEEGIRFENVSFSYSNGHEPIRGLSFALPAGATLAVVGPSGAGKSTLASLLLRLREPSGGQILFDGIDYWQFSVKEFCRAVGFVDQEPFVFNLSIAENVRCGRPGISQGAILKALELVRLNDVIARLPEGADTVLAERGVTLSGGQRQRLAIARAVVVDPAILVLDEPTSALDAETELEVLAAIDAVSVGRTTLIITHRPAAANHATCRLDLGTGKLVALGPSAAARAERASN